MSQRQTVILVENDYIGEGKSRRCYVHPDNKDLCIKVATDHTKAKRSIAREVGYYKRLQWRGVSFEYITLYHGSIETNLGQGEVYDLVRDSDGSIAKSLKYYLQEKSIPHQKIIEMVEILRSYLYREYILFSDLDVENILIQSLSKSSYKPMIIDGIGDNNQIPFLEFVRPLGLKQSEKKWGVFKKQLIAHYGFQEEEIKDFNQ